MEPTLHVTISGAPNTGKTTVSRIIADALKKAGIEVVNFDPEAEDRKQGLFPIEAERLKSFAKGKKVKVITVQTNRAPSKGLIG